MKVMFTGLMCLATCLTYSQRKVHFFARSGIASSNQKIKYGNDKVSTDAVIGFHFGGNLQVELNSIIFIEPGLYFARKGHKRDVVEFGPNGGTVIVGQTSKFSYLEFPLLIGFKMKQNKAAIILETGPYAAMGLDARFKNPVSRGEIEFGENKHKRLDYGIVIVAGVQIKKFFPAVSYDFGLMNIRDDPNVSIRNRNFRLSLGFVFGK